MPTDLEGLSDNSLRLRLCSRAFAISARVAFSASLTRMPPTPRKPPSMEASATFWLMPRSQAVKAAASPGALVSTIAETSRRLSSER